jgi:AcrR family transcriptional regulator
MSETRDSILDATREALVDHGYAGLSMSKVAANFDGSQSLIHHHFDGKAGLLASLVAAEHERAAAVFDNLPDDPEARLDAFVDALVHRPDRDAHDDERSADAVVGVFAELEVAARDHDAVAAELREFDARIRDELAETVARGVESGAFADVDPKHVADLVLAANERAASVRRTGYDGDLGAAIEALVLPEVRQ